MITSVLLREESIFDADRAFLSSGNRMFDDLQDDSLAVTNLSTQLENDRTNLRLGEVTETENLSTPFLRFDEHSRRMGHDETAFLHDNSLSLEKTAPAKKIKPFNKRCRSDSDTEKENKLSYKEMADLVEDNNEFMVMDSLLTIYDKATGMFVPIDKETSDILIRRQAPNEIKNKLTRNIINEIVSWLKSKTKWEIIDGEDLRQRNATYINFQNCTVELPTFKVHKHCPSFYCTNVLNVDYDESYVDFKTSLFFKTLNDLFFDDIRKIDLLQEIFAVTITSMPLKHFYYFFGVPDSGKSRIADVLRYVVGSEFTSAISLKRFDGQFGLGGLYRKRLNIVGESNEITTAGIEVLKRLTGGDYCLGERKYEHAFQFFPQATHIFMSNKRLKILDGQADPAFLNRMTVLEFSNSIPVEKQDTALSTKLKAPDEIRAIIAWTLEGIERLYANNFKLSQLANPEDYTLQAAFAKNRNEKSELVENFKDYLQLTFHSNQNDKKNYITVPEIFEGFKCFMGTDGDFEYIQSKWLHDTLQDELGLMKKRVKPTGQKKQVYAYYGLTRRTENEEI